MATILRSVSVILNVLYALIGFALAAVSIWYFIELKNITNLRNSDRYLLNFKVYWPQAIPWIFLAVGVLLVLVSLCGYCSVCGGNGVLVIYYIFLIIAIIGSIAAGCVSLVYANGKPTDDFISEVIWDAKSEMKAHDDIATAFGQIETRFRCCGAKNPNEYTSWMTHFPKSCCHPNSGACEFSNSITYERHGCIEVVTEYARIFILALSVASLVSSLVGIINLVVAIFLWGNLKRNPTRLPHNNDIDTLKMPLREK
ncbi:23 kDa integral membrane protein-like [Achroia grisella]|uniref:23 kDa integral membrane protein-like n=1 Tax=Achroia grisella TaxID=688607 RepID=UPI0027D2D21D|nr:23 kDa integral membrane protein-like [Achroia grisella]